MHPAFTRLASALALSLAFHLSLILGLQVRPAPVAESGHTVIEARLVPAVALRDEAKPAARPAIVPRPKPQADPPKVKTPAESHAPPEPMAAAAAPAAVPPSPVLPAVDIPLIEDPTYYPAKQLDVLPQPLQSIKPGYPAAANAADVGGQVKMLILIDERGKVRDISVIEAKPAGYGFEESAMEAFRNARFNPALRNGRPVKSRGIFVVTFEAGGKRD